MNIKENIHSSAREVKFYMKIGTQVISKTLATLNTLDQGEWHILSVDHDHYNVRLSLDSTSVLVDLDPGKDLSFSGPLYLGGASSS